MTSRKILLIFIVSIIIIGFFIFFLNKNDNNKGDRTGESNIPVNSTSTIPSTPATSVISKNLNIPWDIAFLPNGNLLVTERVGNLVEIDKDGNKKSIKLPHPVPKGEGGLLGIVLHPHFEHTYFIYLYMTTSGGSGETKNAVFRYKFADGVLSDEKIIIKDIPGAIYHDGGRIAFGPDAMLYITTGDATTAAIAQNLKSLGGKILRLNDDGTIPSDNPFGTAVYSYGHRNPQGLTWDSMWRLWSTEHGRSGVTSGMDELNLIEKGKNYGWPTIEGDAMKNGMVTPVINSGADDTWAPASTVYYKGSIFFGGLKGEALYEAVIDESSLEGKVKELKTHFKNEFGRIRTVRLGADGMLYMTTSNKDGRGDPTSEDDRIIRINPDLL